MGAMRVMAEFESLLSKHHVFDAELTLAGIFEIAHSARSKMIGYLQSTSYLLLLPVVVTDESPAVNSSFRNFPRRQQWCHAEKCKGIAPATKDNHQVKLLGKQLESFPKCVYIYIHNINYHGFLFWGSHLVWGAYTFLDFVMLISFFNQNPGFIELQWSYYLSLGRHLYGSSHPNIWIKNPLLKCFGCFCV